MLPIISIVGKSNSGKTRLLEMLVAQLRAKGYSLATVKHTAQGFDLEAEGKDSWRLAQAGSSAIMLVSPQRLALLQPLDREPRLEELSYRLLGQFDLIFAEGFKRSAAVKIEVHRQAQGPDLVSSPSELFAVVTDEPLDVSVPQYSEKDLPQLAEAIEESFLQPGRDGQDVELFVDGLPVSINPFVRETMAKVLLALLSTLKGIDINKLQQTDVRLRRRGQPG